MFCEKCGTQNQNGALSCASYGQPLYGTVQAPATSGGGTRHDIPRCTCCGYIGQWKLDRVFRTCPHRLKSTQKRIKV